MIQTWEDAEQAMAEQWPAFAPRPQQRIMAAAVRAAVDGDPGGVVLAQAGCGVGKSLAYLIPAASSGARTVVSVGTKALQDQLALKDLPMLRDTLFPALSFAVLKGRSNYVCLRAADKAGHHPRTQTGTGERSDLVVDVDDQTWSDLTVDTDGCVGRRSCPFGAECYSELAKARALEAQILVVNTSLLTQDLRLRVQSGGNAQLLGPYDNLIVDEAHEMPDIVASGLSSRVTLFRLLDLCTRLSGHLDHERADSWVRALQTGADAYFSRLSAFFEAAPDNTRTVQLDESDHATLATLAALLSELAKQTSHAMCNCEQPPPDGDSEFEPVCEFYRRTASLMSDVSRFTSPDAATGGVAWAERDRSGRAALMFSPVEVGGFLTAALWSPSHYDAPRSVLTSATLGLAGDFTFMARRLGLSEYRELDVGTPFDYRSNALLWLPAPSDPSPKADEWPHWARARMIELVRAAGGGALLLFTSNKALRDAYDQIGPVLHRDGLTVMAQGDGRSNQSLAAEFSRHTDSVLFGTRSFFTGVDFPGDTCRLVVVDKLPFASPGDPVFDARCKLVEEKWGPKSSFRRISMPEMSLVLTQAFGRLIRTVDDRGVVAILDNRLHAPWCRPVRRALPPAPLAASMDQVVDFYAAQGTALSEVSQ